MERPPRRRVSYVLPLAQDATAGHRLGVSGLTYDHNNHFLYSGGRDGTIFVWRPGHRHATNARDARSSGARSHTTCEAYYQAHTHWINGLTLAHGNEAVISGSSDNSVKLWRPFAASPSAPQRLGNHADYVKAVANPSAHSSWVASGGLDHHIRLWDLTKGQEQQSIRVTEPSSRKGSVYALAATDSIIASGGPENIVKLWDPRSGKRVGQLIGHTDIIRSILLSNSQVSDTLISCSADKTVKIWSLTAGRCMYNLSSLHTDSVWSLYSDHPDLDVFYSGDRSGLIVKTDSRGKHDIDEGFSIGVCQENEGINDMVVTGDDVWPATANSNLNRWRDISKQAKFQSLDDARSLQRSHHGRHKVSVSSVPSTATTAGNPVSEVIPLTCVLRLPEVPGGLADAIRSRLRQSTLSRRRTSLISIDNEIGAFAPLRNAPEESIEGQHGLTKHLPLNDRRHILTADTAGEIVMWDVLTCTMVKSFGKQHIDEVFNKVNSPTTVPQWFESNTQTGALACTLDEDRCFTAEVYADELKEFRDIEIKEDQRISLGTWVLRYLFDDFVLEEVSRDEAFRRQSESVSTNSGTSAIQDPAAEGVDQVTPSTIDLPSRPLDTPGLRIGVATPRPNLPLITGDATTEGATSGRKSGEDYFSSKQVAAVQTEDKEDALKTPKAEAPATPAEPETATSPNKETTKSFGQRLKGTFTPKKGKSPAPDEASAAHLEEEGSDKGQSSTKTPVNDEKAENVAGVIAEIRAEYMKEKSAGVTKLTPLVVPSLPTETPLLKPPPNTTVMIQEHHFGSGGVNNLFESRIDQLGHQADSLEKAGPHWLGTVLLKNQQPAHEAAKISFLLQPHQQLLPNVTAEDGNERLNANRLMRARKILGYVKEHLDQKDLPTEVQEAKPEDALELYCQDQVVSPLMTLMNIRTHSWRSGGDVVLTYKPKWVVEKPGG